jgi:hypothetical protein
MGNFMASKGVHAGTRRWHGSIDNKFSCIDNIVRAVTEHQSLWAMPPDLYANLLDGHRELQLRIDKCRTLSGSTADRILRDTLFKSMTDLCLTKIKIWAFAKFLDGTMTAGDVHLLGFLLPGETGGRHSRKEATNIIPEVKVRVVNGDFIRVIIDQSSSENAAQAAHGWPQGVEHALIVIIAADGITEVYRRFTTRLHTNIRMPAGSHGKQFIIKAAFLVHVDDEPRFGSEETFSMPLMTEDLAAR